MITIGLTTGCSKYDANPWTTVARLIMESNNDDERGCREAGCNSSGGVSETTQSRDSFVESQTKRKR